LVTADGRLFATQHAADERAYHVLEWDVATGRLIADIIPGGVEGFYSFDSAGRWLAVDSSDNRGFDIWDLPARRLWASCRASAKDGYIYPIAFFPDGERLLCNENGGPSSRLTVWTIRRRQEELSIPSDGGPAAISSDGRRIATVLPKVAERADSIPRLVILDLQAPDQPVECMPLDGKAYVSELSFVGDRLAAVIRTPTAYRSPVLNIDHQPFFSEVVVFAPDGQLDHLIHADQYGGASNGTTWTVFQLPDGWRLTIEKDGRAVRSEDYLQSGPINSLFQTTAVTASPNGRFLAVGPRETGLFQPLWQRALQAVGIAIGTNYDMRCETQLIDLDSGRGYVVGPTVNAFHGAFAPDGQTFVVGGLGQMFVWDAPPRKPLTWFAVAAGAWALPLTWLARRRARRLRVANA
jgi:WD40 repeat protein